MKTVSALLFALSASASAANVSAPTSEFFAFLDESPARAILSGTIHFHITGKGIQNAEIVPQFSYEPILARFTVDPNGSGATLDIDTNQLRDQRLQPMRILAFNRPPGDKSASEIEVMTPRTWYVRNTQTACETFDTINHTPAGFPAILNGTPTTARFCDPVTWQNGQPADCECALYRER